MIYNKINVYFSPQDTRSTRLCPPVEETLAVLSDCLEDVLQKPDFDVIYDIADVLKEYIFEERYDDSMYSEDNEHHDPENNELEAVDCVSPYERNLIIRTVVMILKLLDHPKYLRNDYGSIYDKSFELNRHMHDLFLSLRDVEEIVIENGCPITEFNLSSEELESKYYMQLVLNEMQNNIVTSYIFNTYVVFEGTMPNMVHPTYRNILKEPLEECPVCLEQVTPTQSDIPPTQGDILPTQGDVLPTQGDVPPTQGDVPPTHCPDYAILPFCGHKFCLSCVTKFMAVK